jgi:hypothetical protein
MPSLDKLASLSRRMKETNIKVSAGGGQDGTDDSATVTESANSEPVQVSLTRSHANSPASNGSHNSDHAVPLNTASLEAAMLGVRDAVHSVASEIRLLRTDRPSATAGSLAAQPSGELSELAAVESRMALLTDEVTALREQLEVQAIQLAEILKILQ